MTVATIGIGTACLPTDDDKSGAECSITGWGTLSSSGALPDIFPQQQNAMGSLHNIDFGVCWASWGGSGKKTGSGKVPGTVPGTGSDGFRGLDRFQGSKVWIGSKVPRFGWVPRFRG